MADKSHSAASSGTDLQVITGSRLLSESSDYLVLDLIGRGTFAKVAKCVKLATDEKVAVRIKRKPSVSEANEEAGILQKMRDLTPDLFNCVRWDNSFIYKEHLCEEFELLDITLKEYVNMRQSSPLLLQEIHFVVYQVATALQFLKTLGIAHRDLQPENIMLVDHIRQPLTVKLIGFGSACEVSKAGNGSYMPHTSYRAPETILGLPCNEGIDMWSLGCIAAELFLCNPLYPACCDYETVWMITQTQGRIPVHLLNAGLRTTQFYLKTWPNIWKLMTPYEYGRLTRIDCKFSSLDDLKNIQQHGHPSEQDAINYKADLKHFVELVKQMLQLNPAQRITPSQVLAHPFLTKSYLFDLCCPQSSSSLVSDLQPPSESQASISRLSCGAPNSPKDPLILPKEEKPSIAIIEPRKTRKRSSAEISGRVSSSPVRKKAKFCGVKNPRREMSEGGYSPERMRRRIIVESEERDTSETAPSTVIQLTAQRMQEDKKEAEGTDTELPSSPQEAPFDVIQLTAKRTQEDRKETNEKDTELLSSSKAAPSHVIQLTAQRTQDDRKETNEKDTELLSSSKAAPSTVIQLTAQRTQEDKREAEGTDTELPSSPQEAPSTVIQLTAQRTQEDKREAEGTDTELPSSPQEAPSTVIQLTAQSTQEDKREAEGTDTELPSSPQEAPSTVIQLTAQRTQEDRKETNEKDTELLSSSKAAPSTVIQLTAQRTQEDRKEAEGTDTELPSSPQEAPSTAIQLTAQRTQEDKREAEGTDTELPSSPQEAPSTVIQLTAQRTQEDKREAEGTDTELPSSLQEAPSTVIQLTAQRTQEDRKETNEKDTELLSSSKAAPSHVIQLTAQRTHEDRKEAEGTDTDLPSSPEAAPSNVSRLKRSWKYERKKETDKELSSPFKTAPSNVSRLKRSWKFERTKETKLPSVSEVTASTVIRLRSERKHEDKRETEGTDIELPSSPEAAPSNVSRLKRWWKNEGTKETELPSVSEVTASTIIRLRSERKCEDKRETEGTDKDLPSSPEGSPSNVSRLKRSWKYERTRETDKELSSPFKTAPSTVIQLKCPKKKEENRETDGKDTELPSTSKASPSTEVRRPREKKNRTKIWLIGSSYIRRAEDAAYENFGLNFGLNAKVEWFSKGGMHWSAVLPRFYAELANAGSPPDILVIEAGSTDLGLVPTLELVSTMEQELTQLCAEFPSMKILYSSINQRKEWRHLQPRKANKIRQQVNELMRKVVRKLGGEVIEHPLLHSSVDNIYLPDGVHFTNRGNAVFVTSIRSALKTILQKSL